MTTVPNVNIVENNPIPIQPDKLYTTKTPNYFCCKKNCYNCNVPENVECKKRFAKKICRTHNYINGIQKLGQYPWMVYNLQWGNYPEYLKCYCATCGLNKKNKTIIPIGNVKQCCNCNPACNKLSKKIREKMHKGIGYFKVYNKYQDYTYNTVDGWPPQMASPTGDSKHGHGNLKYIELIRDLNKKVIAFNKINDAAPLYLYKGRLYSQYARVPVKRCNKTSMIQVPCAPGSKKYIPKNILGNSSKAFEFNNL